MLGFFCLFACFVLHKGTFVLSDPSLKELFFCIYSHNYFFLNQATIFMNTAMTLVLF